MKKNLTILSIAVTTIIGGMLFAPVHQAKAAGTVTVSMTGRTDNFLGTRGSLRASTDNPANTLGYRFQVTCSAAGLQIAAPYMNCGDTLNYPYASAAVLGLKLINRSLAPITLTFNITALQADGVTPYANTTYSLTVPQTVSGSNPQLSPTVSSFTPGDVYSSFKSYTFTANLAASVPHAGFHVWYFCNTSSTLFSNFDTNNSNMCYGGTSNPDTVTTTGSATMHLIVYASANDDQFSIKVIPIDANGNEITQNGFGQVDVGLTNGVASVPISSDGVMPVLFTGILGNDHPVTSPVTSPIASPIENSHPSITVWSPNNGGSYKAGDSVGINWSASFFGSMNINLDLYNQNGAYVMNIASNQPNGGNNGSYAWTVPSTLAPGLYKVRVSAATLGAAAQDYSGNVTVLGNVINPIPLPPMSAPKMLSAPELQTSSVWDAIREAIAEYYALGGK